MNDDLAVQIEEIVRNCMITYRHPLKVFGLMGSREYSEKVANHLGTSLTPHVEKLFADGECYVKSEQGSVGNVRGHNVFVIQSLYDDEVESAADKFMKLAFFVDSLRAASAHHVTVVVPYLAWSRQDRKTQSRAPVSTQAVAKMLESVGVQHCLFIDVHNIGAEQNAFRIPIDVLTAKNLHADWCKEHIRKDLDRNTCRLIVVSPDQGGLSRTTAFAETLAKRLGGWRPIEVGILDKLRDPATQEITGHRISGADVRDAQVIIYDDMISTAGTVGLAATVATNLGGKMMAICATHGLFAGQANEVLDKIDCPIVVADTIKPFRLNAQNLAKISFVDTTRLVSDAIWRIHTGTGSISELLQ